MTELDDPPWPFENGVYTGTYTVEAEDLSMIEKEADSITVSLEKDSEQVKKELPGQVVFSSKRHPKIVEVKPNFELGAYGWLRRVQDDVFNLTGHTRGGMSHPTEVVRYLEEGSRFEVTGHSGDYYQVQFSGEDDIYLVHKEAVREIDDVEELSSSVSTVEVVEKEDRVRVYVLTNERVPFLIEGGKRDLNLQFFQITDPEKTNLNLEHPEKLTSVKLGPASNNEKALEIAMELDYELYSYDYSWHGNGLVLDLMNPPEIKESHPLKDKIIVIDPGHGDEDIGAAGPGDVHEKDAALDISLHLEKMLTEKGAKPIMVRTEDQNEPLYDRTAPSFNKDADLFISVHHNAHAHGAEAVDTHGIMTLYNYDHNEALADIMLETVSKKMELPAMWTWERDIAVLRHTEIPSVLVEAGYMKHPEDNWHILHPEEQKQFAQSITEGIEEYFLSLDK